MIKIFLPGKRSRSRGRIYEAEISKSRIKLVRVIMEIMFIYSGKLCSFSGLGSLWRVSIG
jgi:hypothetical protein